MWQAGADDFVRNRLTHSLEVAQIGRELALQLGANADVVDAACLAHDLGHPPFGHFGETVLNDVAVDIGGFEGNAQTFRLLTRLEAKTHTDDGRSVGLNLTRATLDAVSKYPWPRNAVPGTPKFGVYQDDLEIFRFVRSGAGELGQRRCVEAQIMDWADDVAYSVHDIEDGIAARAITPSALGEGEHQEAIVSIAAARYAPSIGEDVLAQTLEHLVTHDLPHRYDGSRRDLAALKNMTSTLIGRFAAGPERTTRQEFGSGVLTRYAADLVIGEDMAAAVAVLKATAAHFIMLTDSRSEQLARQEEALHVLLDKFLTQPENLDPEFKSDLEQASSDAEALRVIIDQVASLTDQRALRLAFTGA